MTAAEAQARAAVVEAGKAPSQPSLVERTWGNVSARVSETHFVITPSGMAYETLRPEDLVLVDLRDRSWQGSRKPSSETGIHADAYRLRPEVGFVIHTHQPQASLCSTAGRGFPARPWAAGRLCALHGLRFALHPDIAPGRQGPGAGPSRQPGVPAEEPRGPLSGTGCRRGLCRVRGPGAGLRGPGVRRPAALATPPLPDLGISRRSGPMFTLTAHGQDRIYRVSDLGSGARRPSMPPSTA